MIKLFFIILLVITVNLSATVINIPDDQSTIQEGINSSVDGDTVLIQPGIYYESINFNGKNITVASLMLTTEDPSYIQTTIIDANEEDRVVTFENHEDSTAILWGVTIRNGYTPFMYGGGIYCRDSSPTLTNLLITGNSILSYEYSEAIGGGIFFSNSFSKLSNSKITYNSAATGGGGIGIFDGFVTIVGCEIKFNGSNNIAIYYGNTSIIESIIQYSGTAIGIDNSSLSLNRCLISDNLKALYSRSNDYHGPQDLIIQNTTITNNDELFSIYHEGTLILKNSLFWDNTEPEINLDTENLELVVSYSDIEGGIDSIVGNGTINWLEGNIDTDPLFSDNTHYYLSIDSPCIDAGDPTSPLDPDGTTTDMGAFFYDQSLYFPIADFTTEVDSGFQSSTIKFTDQSTVGSSGNYIDSWQWDFNNDGIIDSPEQNPQYTYYDEGYHIVSLTVADGTFEDTEVKEIYVELIPALHIPSADFSIEISPGFINSTFNFTDQSTVGSLGNYIDSWQWDFNNDEVIDSHEQNPQYTYDEEGYHIVSLTVADGTYEDTKIKEIFVEKIPELIFGNFPNPFNTTTTIQFSVHNDSFVELTIFNPKGQKVRTLAKDDLVKGNYSLIWHGDDKNGNQVSSGIYFYHLNVDGNLLKSRKMLLVK